MNVQWHTDVAGNPGKPAVLFLHGFLGRGSDWLPISKALLKSHYCLCPDLPGHGRTVMNAPPEGYTMDKVANALLAHLDVCGMETCALVGYSMGGRLALRLALECPDRFPVAVIESAAPGLRTEAEQDARREHDYALAKRLETMGNDGADFRQFLEDWYRQPIFASLEDQPETVEKLIADRLRFNDPVELAAALRGMSVGTQESLWDQLPACKTPTLLIVGEKDRKYRMLAEEMAALAPTMAVEVMADCGHNVHVENPEGYTALLKHFLGRMQ